MLVLLALVWCLYLSECLIRRRPGEWLFSARAFGGWRASGEAEIQLVGGRIGLSRCTFLPWTPAYLVHGNDFDLRQARARLQRIDADSRWLRRTSGLLFVWILGGVTLLILTERITSALLPFAVICALIWSIALATFLDTYRRLHGRRPALEIWLTAALSPVSLMRSPQTVCAGAIQNLHPVTAAALLLGDEEFLRVARLWHFDVHDLRGAIERLATSRALLDRLGAPPVTWEAGVTRFCPRCHETYAAGAERCADCTDVRLKGLPV